MIKRKQLRNQLHYQLRDLPLDQLGGQIARQLNWGLRHIIYDQLIFQLFGQLEDISL